MEQFCSTYFLAPPTTWKFRNFTRKCPIPKCDKKVLEQAWQQELKKIVQENSGPRKQKAALLLRYLEQANKIPELSNVCPINEDTNIILSRIQAIGYVPNNYCVTTYKKCLPKYFFIVVPWFFKYLIAL